MGSLTSGVCNFVKSHTKLSCGSVRQQVQVCTARFKTVFPLAVHIARHKPCGGKAHHFTPVPLPKWGVGETQSERQWKNSFEPCQVDRFVLVSASKIVPGVRFQHIVDPRYC